MDEALLFDTISEDILNRIGQCVLILGPELSVDQDGLGYKKHFREIVKDTRHSKYLHKDNLFHFNEKFEQQSIESKIKQFYRNVGDPMLLEIISRVRFPLIINVCPDEALNNVYRKKNIRFQSEYFTAGRPGSAYDIETPSKDNPLIYNIFGTVALPQSLIFEHHKLYETIAHLLPPLSLPAKLEQFILNTANSFVFLGFNFDSWYYQLVCHKLGLSPKVNISTPKIEEDDHVSVLMKRTFNMNFTHRTPTQFITELLVRCKDDLRPFNPAGQHSAFVSYAWSDTSNPQRADVVSLLDQTLKQKLPGTFKLFRDENEIHFGDSVDAFMQLIGTGKTVFMIISDKYLTSFYCMTEALRIREHIDTDKRVFIVLMSDAADVIKNDAANHASESSYSTFWRNECQKLLAKNSDGDKRKLAQSAAILKFIDGFIEDLTDKVVLPLDYDDIETQANKPIAISRRCATRFEQFINEVIGKLTII